MRHPRQKPYNRNRDIKPAIDEDKLLSVIVLQQLISEIVIHDAFSLHINQFTSRSHAE